MKILIKEKFRHPFSIKTNNIQLKNDLLAMYGSLAKLSDDIVDNRIIAYTIGDITEITFKDKKSKTNQPLSLIKNIIFENTFWDASIFAFHGGAVEYNGKAYLLLAPTTSGKTTLTAYLTMRGLGYITDDCILIDKRNMYVYPTANPIHLRQGGINILKDKGFTVNTYKIGKTDPRYIWSPPTIAMNQIPISMVMFIKRCSENKIINMSQIEKMVELMYSPITPYPINNEYVKFLGEFSKNNIFKIAYTNDMEFVEQVIKTDNRILI